TDRAVPERRRRRREPRPSQPWPSVATTPPEAGPGGSRHGDQVTEGGELCLADPRDLEQVLHCLERPVPVTMGDDSRREHRPDPRKRLEIGCVGAVDRADRKSTRLNSSHVKTSYA